ncbi:MAG TPA: polysaccharide deacetylase family protein [Solirubrobacteraceae bacterium]|nr:polysaccharide deacetylase family protein [Solirubrobacteraceae bacterium]
MKRRPRTASREARRRQVRRRRLSLLAILAALAAVLVALLSSSGGRAGAHHRSSPAAAARAKAGSAPASAPRAPGYPETAELRRLIALGKPIYCAPDRGNEVALTFDDGPGPYTKLMLDKLAKHHVEATFFIVGRNIALAPSLLARERRAGAVGDHTWTHPLLTALGAGEQEAQIARTQEAVAAASGGPVFLFRPPYGAHDAVTDRIARERGLLEILWNVDSRDSLGASYAQIEQTVTAGLRPGSIILMHENHGQTVRAMLTIFAALRRRGLRAVSVPQLLSDDPPSPAQLRAAGGDCGLAPGAALSGG